jgi:adenylate cyclase
MDRRQALVGNRALPSQATGAAIFADISGFTPLADKLMRSLGSHLGAEELIGALNRVYEALVAQVDQYAGSVIGFAGDGLTAWFDENPLAGSNVAMAPAAALRAVGCALAMQNAMRAFHALWIRGGGTAAMGLKVAVAAGEVRRFLAGNPRIQVIEMLAGPPLVRVGAAAQLARDGEVLLDACAASLVENQALMRERRFLPEATSGSPR